MKRREFLKTASLLAATAFFYPKLLRAKEIDYSKVKFNSDIYKANNAKTIVVFLYGGPSELNGNLTNIDEIEIKSQSSYSYFRGLTPTANQCWKEAGGDIIEDMLSNGDLNLFRTCYSEVREKENIKSHPKCVSQNQRGIVTDEDYPGIFANIATILYQNKMITNDTKMPFITMQGDSIFFANPDKNLQPITRPVSISYNLNNPYKRDGIQWYYYSDEERKDTNYAKKQAAFDKLMDEMAKKINPQGKIKENFAKREELSNFIEQIKDSKIPDGVSYPNNTFAKNLKTAVRIMADNNDTKVILIGSGGLGGWDDHNNARNYITRSQNLFEALQAAMNHIKAINKDGEINIVVFGDFGRDVNLNSALGWDHGNLQNLYWLGGKNYFNSVGIVGETSLYETGNAHRMFLIPKQGSYWFEPASIAATLYKIYGITNPEVLTQGYKEIQAGFLK